METFCFSKSWVSMPRESALMRAFRSLVTKMTFSPLGLAFSRCMIDRAVDRISLSARQPASPGTSKCSGGKTTWRIPPEGSAAPDDRRPEPLKRSSSLVASRAFLARSSW